MWYTFKLYILFLSVSVCLYVYVCVYVHMWNELETLRRQETYLNSQATQY